MEKRNIPADEHAESTAWGILGVADIAVSRVVPALQHSRSCRVLGIASRESDKAVRAARRLGIPRAFDSYDDLLRDPEIEFVYIPLPNHLHVPWSIRAARAGKHVLCEKPIGLSVAEVRSLIAAQAETGVRIQEAFMVEAHPQWRNALQLIAAGRIGVPRVVTGHFCYFNNDPGNIRNIAGMGGGALWDVGCYLVYAARRIFGSMPRRVLASILGAPGVETDVLTSALLEFETGHCTFTCSTQSARTEQLVVIGETGRMEFGRPFTPPADQHCRIFINDGGDPSRQGDEAIEFEPVDQYQIQCDEFTAAARGNSSGGLTLSDSLENAAVIEALFRSVRTGGWECPDH